MISSPLNYTGGKYKLLPQILPLFPDRIVTFYDLFGGGGVVSVNATADRIIYNDLSLPVVQIIEAFQFLDSSKVCEHIDNRIAEYNLSKDNVEGYLALRSAYNKSSDKSPLDLYTLICYAFNNQVRFNSKGGFNLAFGKGRSDFNPALRQKVCDFCEALHSKNIVLTSCDFAEFGDIKSDDFVYCDPPYLSSSATYSDGRFVQTSKGIIKHSWTEHDERRLYDFLCGLTAKNVRWALSNNLSCNPLVEEFANKNTLKIHRLDATYANCNYHKKDRTAQDCEVLITNY